MKCFKHDTVDAVGVCLGCGRALCRPCLHPPADGRLVCSENCRAALENSDKILRALLDKSNQSARASAFYCYLTAGLSAAAAGAAWFWLPSPFLIGFTGACALVLFIAGGWHGRVARKSPPDKK